MMVALALSIMAQTVVIYDTEPDVVTLACVSDERESRRCFKGSLDILHTRGLSA